MAEIAGIYFYQGELAKALEININAADFNRKANDQYANSRLSDNYNNIGLIYGELEEYDNALRNYRKAISVSTTPLEESVAAGNMAEIFIVLNEVDSISLYANRCYELEQKLNSPRGIAYAAWLKAKNCLF
jgi:tetratricopeptide (TPR) repeat protein